MAFSHLCTTLNIYLLVFLTFAQSQGVLGEFMYVPVYVVRNKMFPGSFLMFVMLICPHDRGTDNFCLLLNSV